MEKWVKKIKEGPPKGKAVNKDLTIIALEKELSSKLMTVVCINQSKRAGKIEIKFATKEELNRLVSILMVTKD
ncbi:MAG: hypothetical protein QMD03_02315 [Syntrophales bacterium]|nr:hypothetical protein [Syntrophales bacterium]